MGDNPVRKASLGSDAAQRWARELAAWAVPTEILERVPRRPFVFSPEMFGAPAPSRLPLSGSSRVAAEALGEEGSVLPDDRLTLYRNAVAGPESKTLIVYAAALGDRRGVIEFEGHMIDRPLVRRAEALLAQRRSS